MTVGDPIVRIRDLLRERTPASIAEAIRTAKESVESEPENPRFRLALAESCRAAGRLPEAIAEFRLAIAKGSSSPEISFNLGALHAELRRVDEAIEWFEDALRLRPNYPAALNNLGELLHFRGQLPEAENAFVRALAIDPAYRVARFNLGMVFRDAGRWPEAERAFGAILEAEPTSRAAWVALAATQRSGERLDEAAQSLVKAIRLDPGHSASEFTTLGSVLSERGDLVAARDSYERALRLEQGNVAAALGFHLSLPQIYGSLDAVDAERQRFTEGVGVLEASYARPVADVPVDRSIARVRWSNFYLAYQGADDRELQTRYGDWLAGYLDAADPGLRASISRREPGERIRVGFVSRFLTHSTIGMYFGRWVSGLDSKRFDVKMLSFAHATDAASAAIGAGADEHRVIATRGRSIREIAASIREADLDVLIYPELGMDDLTFTLAATRLAPIQCCAWGHPVTPGHPTIDFYFTAAEMEPEGVASLYRERLVGLPGIGTNYPRPSHLPGGSRSELGLPEGRALFLCPQSLFKIHPETDELLAEVLAGVPEAMLMLFSGKHPLITDQFMRRLSKSLEARGMSARERCLVLPTVSREAYLTLTSACDVVLDTLHWSGGNTSLDALCCGLPIVTLPGRFMRGRQSMAMLKRIGMDSLIAKDRDDYVRTAIDLGRNAGLRTDIAREIAARADTLFEDGEPIRELERFLEAAATGGEVEPFLLR